MSKKYVYHYNKKCTVCNKDFVTIRYNTKICSQECVSVKLSENKKFSEELKLKVIELRLQGLTSTEITEITGMGKPSQTKLFKERNIKMTAEQASKAQAKRWEDYEPIKDGKKMCSKCKENLPLNMFHRNKNSSTGLTYQCKNCSSKHYMENSEEIKEKVKKYQNEQKESAKSWHSNNYSKNKGSNNGK